MIPHTTHPSLGASHGFFTRNGGVSEGIYASLNCGYGAKDDPADNVAENLDIVRRELGAERILTLSQIHSDRFIHAEDFDGWGREPIRADGFVCRTPGIAIGVLSADCAPVLFHDAKAGVIGACHAGWRGALDGITDTTLDGLFSLGATPETLRAVVGPCISLPSYEVGEEFRDRFLSLDPSSSRFFSDVPHDDTSGPGEPTPWVGSNWHFDLKAYVAARIRLAGVECAVLGACTYAAPESYFSHRYNKHRGLKDYGRNISAIVLT